MIIQRAEFYVIAAIDKKGGIGKDKRLPWKLSEEMAYFKRITSQAARGKRNVVIMGRETFESLKRPLPDRFNIVLSRSVSTPTDGIDGVLWCGDLNQALMSAALHPDVEDVFVIGGAQVYQQAVVHPCCRAIFLSMIDGVYDCDTFFPELKRGWFRVAYEEFPGWKAAIYERSL